MTTSSMESVPLRRPRITAAERAAKPRRVPHVIAVTSGKGGVGKTHFTANLAWILRQLKRDVMVLDADLGLANIDIVLGLTPDFNLSHVLSGQRHMNQILTHGPGGIRVLPASSGTASITHLSDDQKLRLLEEMESLEEDFDFVLIDTSAGIAENVIYFNLAAQTMIVIVTPEPTSLTDAYALIKVLASDYRQQRFKIVANDVSSEREGMEVFEKLVRVTDRFLNVSLDYLGHVRHDPDVREATRMQRPFCEVFSDSCATRNLRNVARQIVSIRSDPMNGDLGLLWRNVMNRQGVA